MTPKISQKEEPKEKDVWVEYDDLSHAYFEPGDKDYWDGIEFAKDFFSRHFISKQELREGLKRMKISSDTISWNGETERIYPNKDYNSAIEDIIKKYN